MNGLVYRDGLIIWELAGHSSFGFRKECLLEIHEEISYKQLMIETSCLLDPKTVAGITSALYFFKTSSCLAFIAAKYPVFGI